MKEQSDPQLQEELKRYNAEVREKQAEGIARRKAEGKYSGRVPIGYRLDRETGKLEIDPEGSRLVKRVFDLACSRRLSLRKISVMLAEEGCVAKGGKPLAASTLREILANETYFRNTSVTESVSDVAHPTIVTRTQFDIATCARHDR